MQKIEAGATVRFRVAGRPNPLIAEVRKVVFHDEREAGGWMERRGLTIFLTACGAVVVRRQVEGVVEKLSGLPPQARWYVEPDIVAAAALLDDAEPQDLAALTALGLALPGAQQV